MDEMYNISSQGQSKFDNSKYIRVEKIFCSNRIVFELYQDSQKHKNGIVLLKAGINEVANIGDGNSLHIKANNNIYSFKSNNIMTEYDTHIYPYGVTQPFSHKSYIISEKLIREMAFSKLFLAKVNLLNNSYIEGTCSPLTLSEYKEEYKGQSYLSSITQADIDRANKYTAQIGFQKFIKLIESTEW